MYSSKISEDSLHCTSVILSIAFKYFHSTSRTEVTKINDFKLQVSLGRKDILYWRKSQKTQRHEVICLKPLGKWKQNQSCAVTTASSFYWASPPKKIKYIQGEQLEEIAITPPESVMLRLDGLIRPWFASTGPKMALKEIVSPFQQDTFQHLLWGRAQVASYFNLCCPSQSLCS